jgi:hypothetical protein
MRILPLAALLLAGCSLVTHFDPSRSAENNDELCSDGIDNDGNGLTDCQDFSCLPIGVCCNMPVIVLADDFQHRACAPADCTAPDPSCTLDPNVWTLWGAPVPLLCGGGLSPYKSELCYDVGVLSQTLLPLHSGLSITLGVAGVPETAGRLLAGLTLQEQVASGNGACDPIEGFDPVIAAVEARTATGYLIEAQYEHATLGYSAEIDDDMRHEIKIAVGTDRRVSWLLDGTAFATSPADQALPVGAPTARLGLAGRGLKAHYTDVRVADGAQCDAPGAWQPADTFLSLSNATNSGSFDSYQAFFPAVFRNGSDLYLYYTGCGSSPLADGCGLELGAGLAIASDGVHFVRSDGNPLQPPKSHPELVMGVISNDPGGDTVNLLLSNNELATVATEAIYTVQSVSQGIFSQQVAPSLYQGPPGTWDDQEICCATAFRHGSIVFMWFAGHSLADPTWRIGVARSFDGAATFTEDSNNPILREGDSDQFDGRGVTDPEVVFDTQRGMFRLWYTGNGSLGRTSIGYAVSPDGVTWHKFPGNPVLQPGDVGLEVVGSPAVLADEGELRMWLHGRDPTSNRLRIYNVVNKGVAPQ